MNHIESVLQTELRPVAAPEELWDGVEMPRLEARAVAIPHWPWVLVGVAAAALVVASAWGLRSSTNAFRVSINEFRSADPVEVKAWVKTHADMDVPIAANSPAQLVQARLVSGRGRTAEISYRIGEYDATLLIKKGELREGSRHTLLERGATAAFWTSGGQIFTLECTSPEALQAACRLCHA